MKKGKGKINRNKQIQDLNVTLTFRFCTCDYHSNNVLKKTINRSVNILTVILQSVIFDHLTAKVCF